MITEDRTFIDNIIPFKTQIMINGVHKGRYLVSKSRISRKGVDRICTITAYSLANQYQTSKLAITYNSGPSGPLGPSDIISSILNTNYGSNTSPVRFSGMRVHKLIADGANKWFGNVSFKAGTNVWRVLQICAMRLGAKIWFEGDDAYIIDFRINEMPIDNQGDMRLHSKPKDLTRDISESVIGTAEVTDEGIDSVINVQKVTYGTNNQEAYSRGVVVIPDPINSNEQILEVNPNYIGGKSIQYYGMIEGSTYNIPEILNKDDAVEIASNIVDYRSDMQRSIKFAIKEVSDEGWRPQFSSTCNADSISNEVDEMLIENTSRCDVEETSGAGIPKSQYLYMSEYTRYYPKGYSDYTWGKITNADLPQAMSKLMSS